MRKKQCPDMVLNSFLIENSSLQHFPHFLVPSCKSSTTTSSKTPELHFGQPSPGQSTPALCSPQPSTHNQCINISLVQYSSPSSSPQFLVPSCKSSTDPTTPSSTLSALEPNFGHPTLAQHTPSPGSPPNNIGYEPVRVGTQKRKPSQLPADSSASDISITFSPRKKVKLSKKIEHLSDELQPYQQILSKLTANNINKYKKEMVQLVQTLKKKDFLSPDLITNEVQLWTFNIDQVLTCY